MFFEFWLRKSTDSIHFLHIHSLPTHMHKWGCHLSYFSLHYGEYSVLEYFLSISFITDWSLLRSKSDNPLIALISEPIQAIWSKPCNHSSHDTKCDTFVYMGTAWTGRAMAMSPILPKNFLAAHLWPLSTLEPNPAPRHQNKPLFTKLWPAFCTILRSRSAISRAIERIAGKIPSLPFSYKTQHYCWASPVKFSRYAPAWRLQK